MRRVIGTLATLLLALLFFMPAMPADSAGAPTSREWKMGPVLDQGPYGYCVGYSYEALLESDPFNYMGLRHPSAMSIFAGAQYYDGIPDTYLITATNVYTGWYPGTFLKGASHWLEISGELEGTEWTTDTQKIVDFVLTRGPVIISSEWLTSMDSMNYSGYVSTESDYYRGYHAYVCYGYNGVARYFSCQNSWGDWGRVHGKFKITFPGMAKLMRANNNPDLTIAAMPHKSQLHWLQAQIVGW